MEPDEAAASGEPAPEVKLEPLSSPEPEFVEQDEAVPWPEAGVQVAVGVEHLSHSLRVGETGISEGPVPEDPSEVLLKLDAASVLASVRIPRSLLVPVGAPMKSMRWWDKCSESSKRDILLKVGVRDPRDEVLADTPGPVLTMWGEYLPIGLRFNEAFAGGPPLRFVQPAFVKAFSDGSEMLSQVEVGAAAVSFAEVEDQAHRQDGRLSLLKDWWNQNEVLLLCLCDEASNSSALLAVRKTPLSVRFYEVPWKGIGL